MAEDCNRNGVSDAEDIAGGASRDCDRNGVPDECEPIFSNGKVNFTGANPQAMVAADLDGDGRVDLATANSSSSDVSALLGNGDGTFHFEKRFTVGPDPVAIVAADLDGDGRLDLATANQDLTTANNGVNDVSVSADARFGAIGFEQGSRTDPKGIFRFRFRVRAGSSGSSRTGSAMPAFPCWIRLERSGETLRGFSSLDGQAWMLVGETPVEGLSRALLCGIAAYGRDLGNFPFEPLRATVSELEVTRQSAFVRGACNGDGIEDISDAVCILSWLFSGGAAPQCPAASDTNDDGKVDVSDAVALLGYLFLGEAPPPEPFAACGVDPTDDALSCESSGPCA